MTHESKLEQDQSEQRILSLPCSQSNDQLLQLVQGGGTAPRCIRWQKGKEEDSKMELHPVK